MYDARSRWAVWTAILAGVALVLGLAPPAAGQTAEAGPEQAAHPAQADPLTAEVVDIELSADETGYWLVTATGEIDAVDAPFYGDLPALDPGETVVSMTPTPDGGGYWLFTDEGRVVAYGNAPHLGDVSDLDLAAGVLDGVATPDGKGYYMIGGDGGVFTFGTARFHGSVPGILPGVTLDKPVIGLIPNADNSGYWLIAADGGLFSFGKVGFHGSVPGVLPPGTSVARPVIGAVPSGDAYLMVAADGGIFTFGTARFLGSLGGRQVPADIVAVSVKRDRSGYVMADRAGRIYGFGSAQGLPTRGAPSDPIVGLWTNSNVTEQVVALGSGAFQAIAITESNPQFPNCSLAGEEDWVVTKTRVDNAPTDPTHVYDGHVNYYSLANCSFVRSVPVQIALHRDPVSGVEELVLQAGGVTFRLERPEV